MTYDELFGKLNFLQNSFIETDEAHKEADFCIMEFLRDNNYPEIAKLYKEIIENDYD